MRSVPVSAAALLCCLFMSSARAAGPIENPPLPSGDELRQQFDSGDYTGVLRGIGRVLALNPAKLSEGGYDRFDLLMLRGESQLRLKQTSAALLTFHQAAKETKDPQQASVALATESLVRRSDRKSVV